MESSHTNLKEASASRRSAILSFPKGYATSRRLCICDLEQEGWKKAWHLRIQNDIMYAIAFKLKDWFLTCGPEFIPKIGHGRARNNFSFRMCISLVSEKKIILTKGTFMEIKPSSSPFCPSYKKGSLPDDSPNDRTALVGKEIFKNQKIHREKTGFSKIFKKKNKEVIPMTPEEQQKKECLKVLKQTQKKLTNAYTLHPHFEEHLKSIKDIITQIEEDKGRIDYEELLKAATKFNNKYINLSTPDEERAELIEALRQCLIFARDF